MLWRQRSVLSIFITLLICVSFLFCSVRITAYAAGPSLPGDALYPLKTTIENARANLTVDHASRVRLHLALASRRLFEMQSLVKERRYDDIVLAVGEFESNIGKALEAAQSLSKADPARATALNVEISNTPLTYDGILMQTLASIPPEIQPAVLGAINASQSAAVLLGGKQDYDGTDNDDGGASLPDLRRTPQALTTPDSSPGSGETLQMEATPGVASTASGISQATLAPNLPAAPTVESGISVVQGEEGVCRGVLEAVTVENLLVPQGASCTLDGTRVEGNIKVENDASLTAHGVTVIGNIQAEGASMVEVLAGSTVGGSIQLKQGGSARVENVIVNGDSSSSLIMVY